MIDNSTKPQEILVIDDHTEWLDSLSPLQIKIFNCRNKSHRTLVNFILGLEKSVSVVVINLHLLQEPGNNRSDNHGWFLGSTFLENHFPQLRFVYVSFLKDEQPPEKLDYIDFLNYLNEYR